MLPLCAVAPPGDRAEQPRHEIAGHSERGGVSRAVRWQNGKITDLGTLGGTSSFATAINDHGVIAGSSTTPDGALHAFVRRDGRTTDLGVPGEGDAFVTDLNNHGQVVGFAMPAAGPAFGYVCRRPEQPERDHRHGAGRRRRLGCRPLRAARLTRWSEYGRA